MLTWIVAHSEALCNFLKPLLIGFSEAQERHTLNFIEALVVCPAKHKTLAALTRLLRLDHTDEYALADFFRVSPWDAGPVQRAVTGCLRRVVPQIQVKTGWRWLFLSVDDALCRQDVATPALEAVGLHDDASPNVGSRATTPTGRAMSACLSNAARCNSRWPGGCISNALRSNHSSAHAVSRDAPRFHCKS